MSKALNTINKRKIKAKISGKRGILWEGGNTNFEGYKWSILNNFTTWNIKEIKWIHPL